MAKVVEAAGAASNKRGVSGGNIERAMSDAILAVNEEVNAISNRQNISDEKKQEMIAELRSPEEIRRRMLAARDEVIGKK